MVVTVAISFGLRTIAVIQTMKTLVWHHLKGNSQHLATHVMEFANVNRQPNVLQQRKTPPYDHYFAYNISSLLPFIDCMVKLLTLLHIFTNVLSAHW